LKVTIIPTVKTKNSKFRADMIICEKMTTISLNPKTLEKLSKIKKEDESFDELKS